MIGAAAISRVQARDFPLPALLQCYADDFYDDTGRDREQAAARLGCRE